MYDRKLLAKLSTCGWNVINTVKSASSYDDAVPGASISVHTYGDFLNFNPHLHAIVSNGCFLPDGSFQMGPGFDQQDLEEAFLYEVVKMLKHLGLWESRNYDPSPENSSYIPELTYDDSDSQIPLYDYWT
jgi:hypothetical protein